MRTLLALVLAFVGFGLTGCDRLWASDGCNDMWPYCALQVTLDHETWESGTYEFLLSADGETSTCTVGLPLAGLDTIECSNPDLEVGWTDSAWSGARPSGSSPQHLVFHDTPKVAEIAIVYEGREVARKSFRPDYVKTEPNGEGCGICRNAREAMAF
jgi:hypothetical protein